MLALSVIIVNWKSREFVRACLDSLARTAGDLPYEVFVVDNASFDGCGEMIQCFHPGVRFMQSETNLGFAGANNLAFGMSRGRNVLFLNPDTEVLPGALHALIAALESRADAGMAGAQLLNSDGSVQTTCIAATPSIANQTLNCDLLRKRFPRLRMWGMRALFPPATRPTPVQAISGACMLGRRSVLEQVGAFSTCYFMYAEDMDLCLKVERLGYTILYTPDAKIVHHAGGSSSRRQENFFSDMVLRESLLEFFVRHRGRAYAAAYRVSLAAIAALRLLLLVAAAPVLLLQSRGQSLGISLRKWSRLLLWATLGARAQPPRRTVLAQGTPLEV